jgi:hypothetical protein
VANATDDAAVDLLGDRVAQSVEEPVQNLHWRDERQSLPTVHDPVVARRARHDSACTLIFVCCRLLVGLLALAEHVAHGAVENVRRGQGILLRQHVTHVLATHLLSTVRARFSAEKTRPHVAGQHYERPGVTCGGLEGCVIRDIVQHHGFNATCLLKSVYFFSLCQKVCLAYGMTVDHFSVFGKLAMCYCDVRIDHYSFQTQTLEESESQYRIAAQDLPHQHVLVVYLENFDGEVCLEDHPQ